MVAEQLAPEGLRQSLIASQGEVQRLLQENQQLRQEVETCRHQGRHLLNRSADLLLEMDNQGRITAIAEESAHLLGYSPADLLGKACSTLLAKEIPLEQLLNNTPRPHHVECRLKHKKGQPLTCCLNSLPLPGPASRWLLIGHLLTSHTAGESLQHLQNLIYQGPGKPAFLDTTTQMDGILSSQLEGVIQETEKAAVAIFGHVNSLEGYSQELLSFVSQASQQTNRLNTNSQELLADRQSITDLQTFIAQTETKRQEERQQVNQAIEEVRVLRKLVAMVLDISDRTNVLALNARIAAARAGSHGQKFAVVAQEVRNLAEQTGNMARRIDEGIEQAAASVERVLVQRFNAENMANEDNMLHKSTSQITALGEHYTALLSFSESTLGQVAAWNQKITHELTALISKTQFQDITRQRIQQVCRSLGKRTAHAKTLMDAMTNPDKTTPLQALKVEDLMDEYVMASQRITHQRMTGEKEDDHAADGEIILF